MTPRTLLLFSLLALPPVHAGTPSDDIPVYAVSLVGSPYRLGGTAPASGVDCSGFVGHVFRQTVGVELPRDSRAISDAAEPLAKYALAPATWCSSTLSAVRIRTSASTSATTASCTPRAAAAGQSWYPA